uniref:Uncharacterized protein n=1 Tax=Opuntia streptacantha TaxID=393608 RepID=A0A7C9AWG7_OPUST
MAQLGSIILLDIAMPCPLIHDVSLVHVYLTSPHAPFLGWLLFASKNQKFSVNIEVSHFGVSWVWLGLGSVLPWMGTQPSLNLGLVQLGYTLMWALQTSRTKNKKERLA